MKTFDVIQILFFMLALISISPPLGLFMAKVFNGEKTFLHKIFSPLEKLIYKIMDIDPQSAQAEMTWKIYLKSLIAFNFLGFGFVFIIQLFQNHLPFNPQNLGSVEWTSAVNTAVSFMTNTNWQGYAGETTLSYLTQMMGLTVQNFVSAATGIAVFLVLVRGLARKQTQNLGNFWIDLTRSVVYVLLPLSILLTLVLVSQGVIQNFNSYTEVTTLENAKQIIPAGPAASQIAIKQLGTNGGGFFNTNSAHPFENPTPFSNWLQMLAILLIPAALTITYGKMVGSLKQGWIIFSVMFVVWAVTLDLSLMSEYTHNPTFNVSGIMEGKETRFGVVNSLIWSTATTMASNGSVNAMHSSLSPLAGGIAMFNIMLGEIIFGGVGSGLYGMILFILLTVFLSGLMVGRSPEYLGKKVEAFEMKWTILAILSPCAVILVGTALTLLIPQAMTSLSAKGPHGFSEVLYALTSAAGNNGSAFAGLNANTVYFNLILSLAMLIGRFAVIIPVMAIAGNLAQKKISPATSGTFSTDTALFAVLLIAVIIIVGALTFLPALSLGPIVEHLLMLTGKTL